MSWRCGIDPGRWAGKVLHRCETSASDEEEYGNRNHELVVIGNGFWSRPGECCGVVIRVALPWTIFSRYVMEGFLFDDQGRLNRMWGACVVNFECSWERGWRFSGGGHASHRYEEVMRVFDDVAMRYHHIILTFLGICKPFGDCTAISWSEFRALWCTVTKVFYGTAMN